MTRSTLLAALVVLSSALGTTFAYAQPSTPIKRLVVFVPGMGRRPDSFKAIIDTLRHEAGYGTAEADTMSFDHAKSWYSHASGEELGGQLAASINAKWLADGPYTDVVLV